MNPNYCIRPLASDDTDAIVRLYDVASARDANIGPITHEAWASFVRRPQSRGGRDFRVALLDGRLVGLAESSLLDQNGRQVRFFKLLVEPSVRRQGMGTALLSEVAGSDAPADDLSLQTIAASAWADGVAFLDAFGFAHIESEISMMCSELTPLARSLPTGVLVERVEHPPAHAVDVTKIHNRAYASDVSFRSYTVAEMAALLGEQGQELWIIREGSTAAGYCRIEREPKLTWLEDIAIDPSFHRRGLGAALAGSALQAIGVDGQRPAGLSVSSVNRAALSTYRRLGFALRSERRRYSIRQKNLAAQLSLNRGATA